MATSAYADILSVFPGSTLNLYVSTDAPRFRVEFYRIGKTFTGPLSGMPANDIRTGSNAPSLGCTDDWAWPGYAFVIPSSWTTGIYIAMCVEVDANGVDLPNQPLDRTTADGPDRKALFVVRQPHGQERAMLLKVPTATYAAYNFTGGSSTYAGQTLASLRRPGLGTGGPTTFAQVNGGAYQIDVYDPASDRMKVVHLEQRFVRWMELQGFSFDYCTDFDLHFDSTLLNPYQLLLSVGHDEYWTQTMRDAVVALVQRAGNVAFFSGNTCYKYSHYPNAWQLSNDGIWSTNGKPTEDSFTGVSYLHGNGRWDPVNPDPNSPDYWRQVIGYSLQHLDHWALSGVSGVIGDRYTDNGAPAGLIGYECDGAPSQLVNGVLVPRGAPTPPDFMILGNAQLDGIEWEDNPADKSNVCTMGLYTNPGVSFTVGTVDWARVLESGRESRVERITLNVLNALMVREPAGWWSFGGQSTSTPVLAPNLDGRLELFLRGYDGAAHHVWQTAPSTGWSAGWASESGTLAGDGHTETRLSMARNSDGRLQLFGRFSDGSIRYLEQNAPNYTWAPWVSLGGNLAGDPLAFANANGKLDLFVRGGDNQVYLQAQVVAGGSWSGWSGLGGAVAGNLAAGINKDGRLELFARGVDNAIWHVSQTTTNGAWGPWASLGGNIAGDPTVGTNNDGRLEVYVRGGDGHAYHQWQTAPGGPWSGWSNLGGAFASNFAVAKNQSGALELFGRGSDGAAWHVAQTGPNGGWGSWSSFGGAFAGDPAVGTNADGRLELFLRGPQATLWHRWQSAPGVW